MNIKRKWNIMFMFEIAVFVLVISGTAQVASAYDYYEDRYWGRYYDVTGLDSGQTWYSNGQGDGSASVDLEFGMADCNCWSKATCLTQTDETDAYAYSLAEYSINWTWTGPPGEAPGGTFSWELHGDGYSEVLGINWVNTPVDTAYSESSGTSACGADAQAEDTHLFCDVWGWVVNNSSSDCDYSIDIEPFDAITVPDYGTYNDYMSYNVHFEWEFDNEDEVAIAAGTTYVALDSGCLTESISESVTTGAAISYAFTENYAHLFVEVAEFDY